MTRPSAMTDEESAVDRILDAHQHFWDADERRATPFRPEHYQAMAADTDLPIVATVFAECMTAYDMRLPSSLASTGETRFAARMAERHAASTIRFASGIIAFADPLANEASFATVVDAHRDAANGRLRAVRRSVAWDEDGSLNYAVLQTSRGMLARREMRDAAHILADRDLLCETWLYHPQIGELEELAMAVPGCTFILDHAGTPLASGRHAGVAVEGEWRDAMAALADRPNVAVKIGGLVTPGTAVDARRKARGLERWTRDALAEDIAPWLDHLIDRFGPGRCLFETNFPVDAAHCDLGILVGAYLDVLSGLSDGDRQAILYGNAAALYAIT
ncbi:amidohydrolase family protein [Sphingobium chungbukense]|uniref:Amidohydrolase-related domain-containing protein n=1 Tax=Sphingobium chungbukense TaxID=56193 RepID=A0A0M3ASL8_9SPHN|nr:amidohydrolase family protein [Sphingobium chungbukense]KKW91931.1 hypothetical protein YP76_12640 [Sphingobium chungbukense]